MMTREQLFTAKKIKIILDLDVQILLVQHETGVHKQCGFQTLDGVLIFQSI